MTRTERQQEAVRKWIKNSGKGTVVAPTGAGKTRIALISIKALLKKYPYLRVLVVVPTTTLKNQWQEQIDEWGFQFNAEIEVINTSKKETVNISYITNPNIKRLSIAGKCVNWSSLNKCTELKDRKSVV